MQPPDQTAFKNTSFFFFPVATTKEKLLLRAGESQMLLTVRQPAAEQPLRNEVGREPVGQRRPRLQPPEWKRHHSRSAGWARWAPSVLNDHNRQLQGKHCRGLCLLGWSTQPSVPFCSHLPRPAVLWQMADDWPLPAAGRRQLPWCAAPEQARSPQPSSRLAISAVPCAGKLSTSTK